jgi:FtsP/CotA-like multicopper oxidase with cupredoxin domain
MLVLAAACGSERMTGADAEPVLALVADENSDPQIVEVSLEAHAALKEYTDGAKTPVWTYNGTIPGPLIEANVGDELVVHFRNSLPEETTIHWHGVRLPATMDGTLAMQAPIAPGATFEYKFRLKDPGLFWFHPHIRSDVQVEKGLYGVIRVQDDEAPALGGAGLDVDRVVVLDDVRVLPDGTLPTYLDDESKMLGRQGNLILLNGRSLPTLRWQAGAMERLRFVNVANGRFFNLALPGYRWRVIGTDGGLLPRPYDTDHLLISPGERYDVMVIVSGAPGSEVTLMNDPYERGHDTGKEQPLAVAKFVITDAAPLTGRALPSQFADIERLPTGAEDSHIELDEGIRDGELVFMMNGATYPDVPPVPVQTGAIHRFKVRNVSEMDHPLHIHGTFFQVASTNGIATAPDAIANKDTVIVPQMATLELVARFDEPGRWMYHCHVLEHAEGGMMGEIDVEAAAP